jgi:hypothetical protein
MEGDFLTVVCQSHPIPLKNPVCEKMNNMSGTDW